MEITTAALKPLCIIAKSTTVWQKDMFQTDVMLNNEEINPEK